MDKEFEIDAEQYHLLREKGVNYGKVPVGVLRLFLYKITTSDADSPMVRISYKAALGVTDRELRRGKSCVLVV